MSNEELALDYLIKGYGYFPSERNPGLCIGAKLAVEHDLTLFSEFAGGCP